MCPNCRMETRFTVSDEDERYVRCSECGKLFLSAWGWVKNIIANRRLPTHEV